ncbi:MAG: hypothetical protein RL481_1884 [Pseudomonadota bacterium]|jgi:porin
MRRGLALAALCHAVPVLAEKSEDGVSVELGYTAELLGGGGRSNPTYVDNLDVIVEARTGETKFHLYGLYNNGRDFSGRRFPRGFVASNIETGVKAVRLYEAWVEQGFAGGGASVLAGLYDYNSEFDALGASAIFLNPIHGIGNDIAQAGENGPSIFPVTSLGVRVQVKPSDTLTVRAAVLDGVSGDPARPRRTAIKLGKGDGAFIAFEADKTIGDWRLMAGYWGYTAQFEDGLASAVAGASVRRRGNQGLYLRGEGLVAGAKEGKGADAFFRLGRANGRFNEIGLMATTGFHFRAPFAGRPDDAAGLAVSWSSSATRARSLQSRLGEPITRDEWGFEATYAFKITDWLTLQPDLQYVINPAFERGRKAVVGGLRISTSWSFGR